MTKKQYIEPSIQVLCINNPSLVIQVAVRAIMREKCTKNAQGFKSGTRDNHV